MHLEILDTEGTSIITKGRTPFVSSREDQGRNTTLINKLLSRPCRYHTRFQQSHFNSLGYHSKARDMFLVSTVSNYDPIPDPLARILD